VGKYRRHSARLRVERLEDRCLLSGGITELPFPGGFGAPVNITSGPDGNLWFTQALSGIDTTVSSFIGRITTDGTVTEFPIPTIFFGFAGFFSLHITAGPDGNLWFTGESNIGRITTSGVVSEFALPPEAPGITKSPVGITTGPDGNVWFTEVLLNFTLQHPPGRIARVTPSGQITEFPLTMIGGEPLGITAGPDGNLWFTETGQGVHNIGRITPSGVITEFALPDPQSGPFAITAGPDGNLWFADSNNTIGRITPNGAITEFAIPTANSFVQAITAGSDGDLYFTEEFTNKIGRITTSGMISEFTIPTSQSSPDGITAGPDGDVWFAERLNGFAFQNNLPNQIGKFIVTVNGTANQRYVSQLYLDLLHRPVDPIGLANWATMLDQGVERFRIVWGIISSPEYHNLVIQDLYHRLLNRTASPLELEGWQSFFTLGGTVERAEAVILGSDEYLAHHAAFLAGVYADVLHRNIDDTGAQAWSQALAQGMSRADVALAILRSLESDQDEVTDSYGLLLHRRPDATGLSFFTTTLQNGLSNELAIALIAVSDEYLADVGIAPPGGGSTGL
jgi:virginiamycin B lyase